MDETAVFTKIRDLGYRVTPQRQIILDALFANGGHATPLEIFEQVNTQFPCVNRATVYRALDFFCDIQIATKSEIHGNTVYEIADEEPHHHLVCTQCGQVEILSDKHFTDLVAHLADDHGFQADLKHLVIPGVCRSCQEVQE
ncbi:MAG: transcriptional repressor [Anaerolineales bacterium]|nr:transcriptional repressor [Anaerolineales bacterium]MCA9932090.1 transcriptional repressor [Anaerolineales bacterium]